MRHTTSFAMTPESAMREPLWSLHEGGHVVAGVMVVRDDLNVDAHVFLDGVSLYQSRHASRLQAEDELTALRSRCARERWLDPA